MTRFSGGVGYADGTTEKAPGVWTDNIVEFPYFGDVIRNSRRLSEGEYLNKDLTVGNSISIVADPYAREHFHAIRYVRWAGTLWDVAEVTEERPRLILRLGGVYNGPTPPTPPAP